MWRIGEECVFGQGRMWCFRCDRWSETAWPILENRQKHLGTDDRLGTDEFAAPEARLELADQSVIQVNLSLTAVLRGLPTEYGGKYVAEMASEHIGRFFILYGAKLCALT